MRRKIFRKFICIILSLCLFGCGRAYNLNLYTKPSGATVQIGSEAKGITPCNVKIPRDSDLIKDKHIDVTYKFDDGRELSKSYDLRKYEPPDEIANCLAAAIALPGVVLIGLTETDEDDQYTSFDKEDSDETDREIQLIALGLIGVGVLIYYVFGNDPDIDGYDIYEIFDDGNIITSQ